MSSFILQLLIISAFGLMVQSAPVNDVAKRSAVSKKEMNQRKLENNLYCAAQSLYDAGKETDESYTLPPLSKIDVNSNTKRNMNRMLHHFSDLCKYFTKAVTLKHQLQEHLFNSAPEFNSDNHNKISTVLTSLQTMANIFDDM